MQKARYEVDPYNRFVLARPRAKKSGLPRFRKVLDGRFGTDENNNLTYNIKSPLSGDESIPNRFRLKGTWSLTDDHSLRLILDKEYRETFGDKIILQGEMLDADKDSLLFALTTKTKEGTRSTYVLDLEGVWQADEYNKLSFHVKKEGPRRDILTFNGAWEIDKNHRIVYSYEKARLLRKKRDVRTVTFNGFWDIKDALRISYLLSAGTDSKFEFRTSAGLFKEKMIRYELGIGTAGRKAPVSRSITLFGKWAIKRDVGLAFEIKYEEGRKHDIIFGADAKLAGKDTISFRLKSDADNKDMGVDLKLSREILGGDGEAFLNAIVERGSSAIYAGAAWRW